MVKFRTADGQRLAYPPGDDVAAFLNAGWYEFRETGFFYRFLRKGDRFLDIGAHCGLYSAIAKAIAGKTGYVLAVEPGADLAAYLAQNLGLAGPAETLDALTGEGCEWLQAAAMDKPGVVFLSDDAVEKSAYRDVSLEGGEGQAVPAVTGDQLVGRLGKGFGLIKIDVEGVEGLVLAGLSETLRRFPETVLMIEFTEANQSRHQASTEALAAQVRALGLGLYEFDDSSCRLVPVEDDAGLEHKNLFACRDPDAVNDRLQTAPAKQILWAEEVFERGRASERFYSDSLLFKNFRARGAGWLGQIAGSLRHLRGDSEDAARSWSEQARAIETARTGSERANALAALIEDGLGQLEGTTAFLAETLAAERREYEGLKGQAAEAEALIVRDLRPEPPSFEMAIRAGMETLAADVLLLRDVRLALPASVQDDLARRLDAYSARVQREMPEIVSTRIELQRLRPVLMAAGQQLKEAKTREAAVEAALAASRTEMESRQAAHENVLAGSQARIAALEEELRLAQAGIRSAETRASELAVIAARSGSLEQELAEAHASLNSAEAEVSQLKDELAEISSHAETTAADHDRLSLEFGRQVSELKTELSAASSSLSAELARSEALRFEVSELDAKLASAASSLHERDQRLEEQLQETARLFDALNAEHKAELDELRMAVSEAKSAAGRMADEYSAAQAAVAEKSAQLADMSVIIGESARELANLAHDAGSDHEVIRDLVRSVRASRVATLAAALGTGPRRATTQMMGRTAAARAKIAEIMLKADFLKSVSAQAAQQDGMAEAGEAASVPDAWSIYGAAVEGHSRGRREAINRCAREDLQAIGRSIDALRRSRFMKLAATLGLQASRELDRLYEIYCASESR